jgi:xylulose-5-phosphate/fructose-6-phosphate phosphoketolase
MAAAQYLLDEVPELRIRVVNVTDLMVLGTATEHPHGLSQEAFVELFTADRPVIFNFHGYPGAIRQLLFGRPSPSRFQISGYQEEGTTTTPFDMHVQNGTSRWHIVQRAVRASSRLPASRVGAVTMEMERRLTEHRHYIDQYGADPDEIAAWTWHRQP